jgi:excinuclease ABC subunit A
VRRRKGEHKEVFESARKSGFVRVRVDGEIRDLSDNFELDKQKWHNIDIVVDRLVITEKMDMVRISDSTEAALKQAEGIVLVDISGKDEMIFSEEFSCVYCNVSLGEIEPRTFSFNNPHGACSTLKTISKVSNFTVNTNSDKSRFSCGFKDFFVFPFSSPHNRR